jgi:uncharacterized protein YndB with AHSA1/START domain
MTTDRIEKKILLRAPRKRVWKALTDSTEFEKWFGVKFHGPFKPGVSMRGELIGTSVDAEVAKMQRQYVHKPFELTVETMEPERLFSFRWHPYAVDPSVDYSAEPTTLVEFVLEEAEGGVMLTVTESGFDKLPLERRAKAFTANNNGWGIVVTLIERYLAQEGHGK